MGKVTDELNLQIEEFKELKARAADGDEEADDEVEELCSSIAEDCFNVEILLTMIIELRKDKR